MTVPQGGVDGRGAGCAVDGDSRHGHLCQRHLQADAGIASSDDLQYQFHVSLGIAAVTALPALGDRESVSGLPHAQDGRCQPGPVREVTDGQV
jgi:hypothetical protein